jgi:galactose oxidase-like protein
MKPKFSTFSILAASFLALLGSTISAPPLAAQTWAPTGSMSTGRADFTATLLPNGMVLVAGGNSSVGGPNSALSSAELYDPATGTFTPTGSMISARSGHTATLLPNGKVLVAGGGNPSVVTSGAELYDPTAGTFAPTGSMISARGGHTATLLGNGKVLVAGGTVGNDVSINSAEIYDPATGAFTATGSLITARAVPTGTMLGSGQVLVAGGFDTGVVALATAELYDPSTGTFTATGSMNSVRFSHTATLLSNGTVLVAGGSTGPDYTSTADLYDPATGTFTATGSMTVARAFQTAALLNNGQVLVAGGQNTPSPNTQNLSSSELYDPATGTFTATGSMTVARTRHVAALLGNGQVLVAGGYLALTSAELFQPIQYDICSLYDETKSVKSGAAYPIKLYLCDANGADVSSSSIIVHATYITGISNFSGTVDDTGDANPDNDFRFDSTLGPSGGYIFNLSTQGLASGTYMLLFTAGADPTTHSVNFGVH